MLSHQLSLASESSHPIWSKFSHRAPSLMFMHTSEGRCCVCGSAGDEICHREYREFNKKNKKKQRRLLGQIVRKQAEDRSLMGLPDEERPVHSCILLRSEIVCLPESSQPLGTMAENASAVWIGARKILYFQTWLGDLSSSHFAVAITSLVFFRSSMRPCEQSRETREQAQKS